jgi:hypothetical protein
MCFSDPNSRRPARLQRVDPGQVYLSVSSAELLAGTSVSHACGNLPQATPVAGPPFEPRLGIDR